MHIKMDDTAKSSNRYFLNEGGTKPGVKMINISFSEEELDMLKNGCGPDIQAVDINGTEYLVNISGVGYDNPTTWRKRKTMKTFDVIEIHMRGDENLREMKFIALVLEDRRLETGFGHIKLLALTKEPTTMTVGIWMDGLNTIIPRPEFKVALINDGGYASLLTDVTQWIV